MKNLYIIKNAANNYSFHHGPIDFASGYFELSMSKSSTGWIIEVTDLTELEAKTTFLWVAETAREAVKDCLHSLRYIERHKEKRA